MTNDFASMALHATLAQIQAQLVHDDDYHGLPVAAARRAPVVLDIGANRGQSIVSLKQLFPDSTIHAFEPNPLFFPVLERLGEIYEGTLTVHQFGLSSRDTSVAFYVPWVGDVPYLEEASTRRDYFEKPWVEEKFRIRGELRLETTTVNVRRGDEFRLNPDIVKIDVEGAEFEVLRGLRDTVQTHAPILLVENSAWETVTPFLAELDYAPYRWEGEHQRFVPFYGATTNTFYFRQSHVLPMSPASIHG